MLILKPFQILLLLPLLLISHMLLDLIFRNLSLLVDAITDTASRNHDTDEEE